jgi:hypothetical protein
MMIGSMAASQISRKNKWNLGCGVEDEKPGNEFWNRGTIPLYKHFLMTI